MEITSVNYQPIAYSYDRPSTYTGEPGTPDGLWENADSYESSEITKVVHPANKDFYVGEYSQTSVKSMEEQLEGWTKGWSDDYQATVPGNDITDQYRDSNGAVDTSQFKRVQFQRVDSGPIIDSMVKNWIDGKSPLNSMTMLYGTVNFNGFSLAPKEDTMERMANAKAEGNYNDALASLTPEDFYWSDISGLQALTLDERSEFRTGLDTVLKDAGIDVNTSKLHFKFSINGDMVKAQGTGVDKETSDSIIEIFNSSRHESEDMKNLTDRLRELGKRNSEVNLELLSGLPGADLFAQKHF